jgi:tetratricopeptide (TPR) repeat protein
MTEQDQQYQQAMNGGHSAAWDQDWERAASFYGQALDEIPEDPKALTSLALAFLNLQDFENSLKYYLRVAEVSPNDPVPLEKAATLYVSMGQNVKASKLSDQAANLYLKEKNADKAIENWARAVAINPENLQAHSRLAVVYQKIGRKPQAIREYLLIASLLQHADKQDNAFDAVNRAIDIDPDNKEAQQALAMLRAGTRLPKPALPQGGTGPFIDIPKREHSEIETTKTPEVSDLNPIEEAQREALSNLARLFFDQSSESDTETKTPRRGLQAITDGDSPVFSKNADRTKIMLHLGLAVELQTSGNKEQAAEELKGAINAGLDSPAANFSLGVIQAKTDQTDSAIRHLKNSIPHADFSLGARLILADIWYQKGKYKKSAERYLEALRSADSKIVAPKFADDLIELYEPLLESLSREKDQNRQKQICENIAKLLVRPNWRMHIMNSRSQFGDQENGTPPTPLAEMLLESSSSDVVVAMSSVRNLARAGHLGAAIEEILFALQRAPTYLPLHVALGDLLVSRDLLLEASQKFNVIARAYSVRGESRRAIAMLRRVVDMLPMDLEARGQLIAHLVARGKVDESIEEYLKLAEVHYSMAELQKSREAYSQALNLTQQSENSDNWQTRIMHRIADIETQSLNWQKAVQLYKQICTLRPNDSQAYRNLVSLLYNLEEPEQALVTTDEFISYMEASGENERLIQFLEDTVADQPERAMIHYRLAAANQKTGNDSEAIKHYDMAGELLLDLGDKAGAGEMIQKIVAMNPPEKEKYQRLLDSI